MNSELVSKISRVKYVWVVLTHQLGRSWPNLSKFLRCKEGGEFLYKQSSVQVCFGMPEFAVPYNQQKCSRAVTLCIFVLCSTIMFNGKSNLQLSYTKMVKYRKWIMYFKIFKDVVDRNPCFFFRPGKATFDTVLWKSLATAAGTKPVSFSKRPTAESATCPKHASCAWTAREPENRINSSFLFNLYNIRHQK